MKLSEAIRLGAMLGPQLFGKYANREKASCALGAAFLAVGYHDGSGTQPWKEVAIQCGWPELLIVTQCPVCDLQAPVYSVIVCLNDVHGQTREQIADYIATIEPADLPAPAPVRAAEQVEA